MDNIKDIISRELDRIFLTNGTWYMGELEEKSSSYRLDKIAILLKKDDNFCGYFVYHTSENYYEISNVTPEETYHFNIYPKKIEIILEQPQITKEELVLSQAAEKVDWVSQTPLKLCQDGNYAEYMQILEESLNEFKEKGHASLHLPRLIK